MKHINTHDQRGAAMFLELVLVAAVLGLVGVAVYQANHRANPTAAVTSKATAPDSPAGLANAAAAIAIQDSDSDNVLSATADATAGEVTSSDDDAANLGDTLDANSF